MMTAHGVATGDGTDVQRTYRSSPARTWRLLTSPEGAAAWLGDAPSTWWTGDHGGPDDGDVLQTQTGERYEVCDYEPGQRIRLRTLGPVLTTSLIELTLTPERGRTIVNLHQEPDAGPQQQEHWTRALDRIGELLDEI